VSETLKNRNCTWNINVERFLIVVYYGPRTG